MTTTAQAIAEIERGALANMQAIVKDIIANAAMYRPAGHVQDMIRRREHYEGRGSWRIKSRLTSMFENDAPRMAVWDYNFAKLDATVKACVYDIAPRRWLQDASGTEIDEGSPAAQDFARTVTMSNIDNAMAECERRAQWCGAHVVVVRSRQMMVDGAIELMPSVETHWAEDVHVLPSDENPSEIQLAHAVAIRICGPDGPSETAWWELWTRAPDGWYVSQLSESGDNKHGGALGTKYAGAYLPIAVYRTRPASVGVWPSVGSADVDIIEGINADISDWHYTKGMQSHTPIVYQGIGDKAEVKGGPGSVIKVLPNEQVTSLSLDPHTNDHALSVRDAIRTWAIMNRQSPSSYTFTEGGTAESGIARLIANEPQDKQRAEQLRIAEVFERTLGDILRDVHDTFCRAAKWAPLRVMFQPRPRPSYEDVDAKQQRAIAARDAGFISAARAAVESGWYVTIGDALDAGLLDTIEQPLDFSSSVPAFESRNKTPIADDTGGGNG